MFLLQYSTNPTRYQHPVAGTYRRIIEQVRKNSCIWWWNRRTLHPDNMAAGPASYGMTDTMGECTQTQFAGCHQFSSVEMMGLIGMGNNPMVGATVAVAVAIQKRLKRKF